MRKFNLAGIKFPISKADLLERHGSMPVLFEAGRTILLKELVELEMVKNFESELELQFFLAKAYKKFQRVPFIIAMGGHKILSPLILSIQSLILEFGFI